MELRIGFDVDPYKRHSFEQLVDIRVKSHDEYRRLVSSPLLYDAVILPLVRGLARTDPNSWINISGGAADFPGDTLRNMVDEVMKAKRTAL